MYLSFHKFIMFVAVFIVINSVGCATQGESKDDLITVSGTAAYRQRIAMPPEAVLTVSLEDVSRADTVATILAESKQAFGERQVPLEFALQVPNSKINPDSDYNLRAKIDVGGQMHFITTRSYPVLTRGAKNKVDLWLDAVQPGASGQASARGFATPMADAADLGALPATFSGVTPCADCPGIEETLTLRNDGLFLLRRIYQDKSVTPFVEHGRWTAESNKLTLSNASGTQYYEKIGGGSLRKLDTSGNPIDTTANIDLTRAPQVESISEAHAWRGEFRYMADAATFTDCESGIRWPVAMIGDYLTAERAYMKARNVPGAPLVVDFQGKLEQRPGMEDKVVEMAVIEKFGGTQPKASCAASASGNNQSTAELINTYWKLVELDGKKIPIAPSHKRQIRITLASEGSRVIGFSGCNQFTGTFKHSENELRFSQMAGTMMACESPFMELEGRVLKMLNATTAYRIKGEQLFLLEGDKVLARFESLYLR
ncbi:YbaY family lipoprotein [Methyloglobulus sp.]|uniref:YbaY family lipoprotein n=1 Tax=Methyloglobulus sp. TaxID=2518622 RepID=UPI0032B7DED9